MKTIKTEELPAPTAKVVSALRGDALACAMDLGIPKLMDDGGLELLTTSVQASVFLMKSAEATELLKLGTKAGGLLSRMNGESMTSYILCRKR